jgi:chromosome segregation ATPase
MLSHQIGAGQRADLKRLDETEAALKQLQRDFDNRQRRQIEDREQQIDRLESALRSVREQLRTCQASESQLRQTVAELSASATVHKVEELRDTLSTREQQFAHVEHHANALQLAVGAAEQDVATLQQEHQDLAAECEAMERFIVEALSNDCEDCDELTCANHPDLGGRRILCVGGRARLIDQYRDRVTRCNGRFEHYDGGIEESRQRLDALLSSADAVVCATDSVSHDAYYRLKRFCKRADKPHVFMRNSGMSSFTRAIYGVAGRA